MRIPRKRAHQAAVIAVAIGTVLSVIAVSMMLGGPADKSDVGDQTPSTSLNPDPYPADEFETAPTQGSGAAATVENIGGPGAADPFSNTGSDRTLHKVVIRFRSDGGLYAGWRYRSKSGAGLKVANGSLTLTRTVRGPLPVAQAAVQALQTSTYATCEISVDGVVVATQRAKGAYNVVVCTG